MGKSGGGGGGKSSGSGKSSGGGRVSEGGRSICPRQTQQQITSAVMRNPNSSSFWQTRGLDAPGSHRVEAAAAMSSSGPSHSGMFDGFPSQTRYHPDSGARSAPPCDSEARVAPPRETPGSAEGWRLFDEFVMECEAILEREYTQRVGRTLRRTALLDESPRMSESDALSAREYYAMLHEARNMPVIETGVYDEEFGWITGFGDDNESLAKNCRVATSSPRVHQLHAD